MSNSWTGGQYSIFRALLGAYLLVHFAALLPYGTELFSNEGALAAGGASPLLHAFPNVLALCDTPSFVQFMLALGCASAVSFAVGWRDRTAAIVCWYILACLFGRNPLISNPSLPYLGLMLVLHALLPSAPYGSVAARGRPEPSGAWEFSGDVLRVAWILLAAGYSYSGYTKLISPSWLDGSAFARLLENPLARATTLRTWILTLPAWVFQLATWGALAMELLFAPLALVSSVRKWIWLAMALMHVGLVVLIDFADLSMAMLLFHLFIFNPGWVPAGNPGPLEHIFYDGHCGLCHRTVRFVLAEDLPGGRFQFAPLHGPTFDELVPAENAHGLPDSIVVRKSDGTLLVRSAAVLYFLSRLGGLWRVISVVVGVLPSSLRDLVYDGVAAIRHRLFASPAEACPLIPPTLRARFEP